MLTTLVILSIIAAVIAPIYFCLYLYGQNQRLQHQCHRLNDKLVRRNKKIQSFRKFKEALSRRAYITTRCDYCKKFIKQNKDNLEDNKLKMIHSECMGKLLRESVGEARKEVESKT